MRPDLCRRLTLLVCALTAVLFGGRVEAQTHHGVELVHADLLVDTTAIQPSKPFTVGLRLKMQSHWHTYWQYSGDAGLPTKIAWQLPAGFKAGPIQWPVPEKIVSPGDIINYGYDEEVMLLTEITPPANLPPGEVTLQAKADWLVCADICVPGKADLSLKTAAGGIAQPANEEIFRKYRALLPKHHDPAETFGVRWEGEGKDLMITIGVTASTMIPSGGFKTKDSVPELEFYPLPKEAAEIGHPSVTKVGMVEGNDNLQVKVRVPVTSTDPKDVAKVGGVLVARKDGRVIGWSIPSADVVTTPGGFYLDGIEDEAASPTPAAAAKGTSFWGQTPPPAKPKYPAPPAGSLGYFLLLGFLGGLILNVMPCVLPVISLKLFSFIKQANEAPERVLRLGLAYAAGVFAWFLGFAGIVVALKAAGHEVGYAFHLQNAWFLVALSAATFVFSLNLLGVFEIILPGGVTNTLGATATRHEGYVGAFLQGVLATVLGSACTAPVFGAALGFAFSQNGPVIFAMFAAIAAGMSAPFVLLAAQPRWLAFLPKPGEWMERVKQATGFLMLATVLWLLWTLGRVRGADAVIWTGALMLVLGAACWVQGTFNTLVSSDLSRWISRGVIAFLLLGGGWFCGGQIQEARLPVARDNGSFAMQLDTALKTGRLVFVDFTADWCVNCKVNERGVLSSESVQKALRDHNAVFLKADWTTGAEDITKLLRNFGRAGVPLYIIYPPGSPDSPVVMPELLTQQIVLDAFAEADHRASGKPVAAR